MDVLFGKKLVSIVIGYLVSGYHGVSESEMLDLLSCNNEALLLSYSRDMPCVLRFPLVLWQQMYQRLGKILLAKVLDLTVCNGSRNRADKIKFTVTSLLTIFC